MLTVTHPEMAGRNDERRPHLVEQVVDAMIADKWSVRVVFAAEEVHDVVNRPWPNLLPLAALARVGTAAYVLPIIVDACVRGVVGRQDRWWRWSIANGSRGSE